jgi:hypothetical protein
MDVVAVTAREDQGVAMRTRTARFLSLVACVVVALALTAASASAAPWSRTTRKGASLDALARRAAARIAAPLGAIRSLSGDDDIPGIALGPSPVTGQLTTDFDTEDHDVYNVALAAGKKLRVTIEASASVEEWGASLYGPGTTDIGVSEPLLQVGSMYDEEPTTVASFVYVVPPGKQGTYYLDLFSWYGSGAYKVTWDVTDAEANDIIPGTPAPASPIVDALSEGDDTWDVWSVHLDGGQRLTATLTADPGTAFSASVYATGEPDVARAYPLSPSYSSGYPKVVTYVAPTGGGTYCIVVERDWYTDGPPVPMGSGNYRVDYAIDGGHENGNVQGVDLGPSPVSGSVDATYGAHDVRRISLQPGQRIDYRLTAGPGTSVQAGLFEPGLKDVYSGDGWPVAYTDQDEGVYPRTFSYLVPIGRGGDYYVDVVGVDGAASYTASYTVTTDLAAAGSFTNPIGYDLRSFLKTSFKLTASQDAVKAKLVVKTKAGDVVLCDKTLSNAANTPITIATWNGMGRDGKRPSQASQGRPTG